MSNSKVLQTGNVTPTHLASWTTDGVIQDAGVGTVTASGLLVTAITRNQIATTPLSANTTSVVLGGYATMGDAGSGATYTSVGATSGGLKAIQDSLGVWWNLVPIGGGGPSVALGGTIPVGWFGAACDQATDDTAAVTAGIKWAIQNQGTIQLQNNLITSSITFTAAANTSYLFFNIIGVGEGPSLIASNPTFSLLKLDAGASGAFDTFTLRNLNFYNTGNSITGGTGLEFACNTAANTAAFAHFELETLIFSNLNIGFNVSSASGINFAAIDNLRVFNCTNGIKINTASGTGTVWSNINIGLPASGTGTGIQCGNGTANFGDQTWLGINGGGGAFGLVIQAGPSYGDFNQVYGFQWDNAVTAALSLTSVHHFNMDTIWTNTSWSVDGSCTDTNLHQFNQSSFSVTANQNNYSVSPETRYANLYPNGNYSLTGLMTAYDGRLVDITNAVGATSIIIAHENTGSSVGNRFELGGTSVTLTFAQSIQLRYSAAFARWVRVGGQ